MRALRKQARYDDNHNDDNKDDYDDDDDDNDNDDTDDDNDDDDNEYNRLYSLQACKNKRRTRKKKKEEESSTCIASHICTFRSHPTPLSSSSSPTTPYLAWPTNPCNKGKTS